MILNTSNLSVGYDEEVVVRDVDIQALKGQMITLLGPNGSGKTTILRTLAGLLSSVEGHVFIQDQKMNQLEQHKLSKILSVVLTERPQSGLMSVFDLVCMGRYPHTGFLGKLNDKDLNIAMNALEMVHAKGLAQRFFNELSDGEKQKVLLARALCQEPEVMILDEPTIHLDVNHKIEVIGILKKLCQEKGITVILSLHEIDLVKKSCDYVLLVKDGQIMEAGYPEDVIRDDSIEKLYDIKSARYSDILGSIEFLGHIDKSLFVVGGNGQSAQLLRSLNKKGYKTMAGVLHENDIDYHVAKSLNSQIIQAPPFERIGIDTHYAAVECLLESACVIDTPVIFNEMNKSNQVLIETALKENKRVMSLRTREEAMALYGKASNKIEYYLSVNDLVEKI